MRIAVHFCSFIVDRFCLDNVAIIDYLI